MKRDDLRVWEDMMGIHRPVSDADLASLGYVKGDSFEQLAEAVGYVKRPVCGDCDGLGEDLSTSDCEGPPCPSCGGTGFGRLVSADEVLGSMGQVRFKEWAVANGYVKADEQITWNEYLRRCAEAQGYVKLDGIDVEAARRALDEPCTCHHGSLGIAWHFDCSYSEVKRFVHRVLAAIDQEDT